ncbi:MAG: hypothetical protein HGA90_03370 [Alphaproteobacteria bacterium]|nr:hypothetical protein [Alphaproteobacteria bacterium]
MQKQAVTGLFLAAAGAMTMPHSYRSYFFVGALIANTLVLIPFSRSLEKLYGVLGSIVFHKLPINKHAAIDTSGYRIGGDPQETQNVIDNFRVDSRLTLAITSGSAVLSLLAPTALSTFSPLTGLIANLTLPTLLTLGACWRLRAAKKLEKGEWTLHTAPPLPHKKEEKARVPVGVKAPVINDYSLR